MTVTSLTVSTQIPSEADTAALRIRMVTALRSTIGSALGNMVTKDDIPASENAAMATAGGRKIVATGKNTSAAPNPANP